MKYRKVYQIALFVVACIFINYFGKKVAADLNLPLWLDSIGTVLCAYSLGPVCGSMVGVANNVIFGFTDIVSFVYVVPSIAIAVATGILAKKSYFEDLFHVFTAGMIVTLVSWASSLIFNFIFYDGTNGNLWGDSVISFFDEINFPHIISAAIGEFYIDFIDKMVTMVILYITIYAVRHISKNNSFDSEDRDSNDSDNSQKKSKKSAKESSDNKSEEIDKKSKDIDKKSSNSDNKGNDKKKSTKKAKKVTAVVLAIVLVSAYVTPLAQVTFADKAEVASADATDGDASASADATATESADDSGISTADNDSLGYNSYVQTLYDSENGLPCGEANAVANTGDGILWIGTYAGLYRYNGTEFKLMDYDSVKNVNCLFTDSEGRLWIGTNDNGLSIAIKGQIANVVDEESGLPADSVRSIAQCSDGKYYIGTSGSMQVISLNGGLHAEATIPEANYAMSTSADNNGNVATVTSEGELLILNDGKVVSTQNLNDGADRSYTACAFDSEGNLYCGTSVGISDGASVGTTSSEVIEYVLNEGKLTQKKVIECGDNAQDINSLSFDEDGNLFVCCDNCVGYIGADDSKYQRINTGSFNSSIDNVEIDYQGNLWFASSRMGLLRLSESTFNDYYSIIGMESAVTNSVLRYEGNMYVGTDSGLDVIDTVNMKQVNNDLTELLEGTRVRCLAVDNDNHLWICTYGLGLIDYYNGEYTYYNSSNSDFVDKARVVIVLSDGTVVAAGDATIVFIKDGKITNVLDENDGIENTLILSLLEVNSSTILVGTDGDGIIKIVDEKIEKTYKRSDGLSSGVVLRLVNDTTGGGVYIVTSNGLCYMKLSGEIVYEDDFPYSNNFDIWEGEDNKLFVLGSAGIYVVDKEEYADNDFRSYKLLNTQTGLTSSLTANSWDYMENGWLYMCTDSGIISLNLYSYDGSSKSYRLYMNGMDVDGEYYNLDNTDTVKVGSDAVKITLSPDIINFTTQDPTVQYYLEGFDTKKTVLNQSELSDVSYTNLPGGIYTFHLAVIDDDGKSVLEEETYTFEKEINFYDNDWFQVYIIIVLVLIVAWVTWFIVRVQNRRVIFMREKELEFAKEQIKMGNQTILAIAKTVDAKDLSTSHHSQRVSEYSMLIAKEYGMSDEDVENIGKIGLLHDIGKIGIPDSILNKPGKLTDEEYAIMKSHVTRGAEVLKDFTLIPNVLDGCLYHHERYDGKGYAHGLKGEEIPVRARIIGIADAFDAMTANRVYRKRLDIDYVINELKRCSGTQFDPQFVDIMLKLIDNGTIDVERIYNEAAEEKGGDN